MIKLLPLLFAYSLAVTATAQDGSCTATLATIGRHVGDEVKFCGTPSTVRVSEPGHVKGDPVYLNFGGTYPNHTFSVVIWGDVAGEEREELEKRYGGKALRIHGMVKKHQDKPSITVKSLEDIEVE